MKMFNWSSERSEHMSFLMVQSMYLHTNVQRFSRKNEFILQLLTTGNK